MASSYDQIAEQLVPIARNAGKLLLGLRSGPQEVSQKEDGTPSCLADIQSESLIIPALRATFPFFPIVSEERIKDESISDYFFLVDPLDGTADFINGGEEFCVNIALIHKDRPVSAVIYAPMLGQSWFAGETAYTQLDKAHDKILLSTCHNKPTRFTALTSNRYGDPETEAALGALPLTHRLRVSSAIKFGMIAEGNADIYMRHGRTMEWDTAAGDLIVTKAGGIVFNLTGAPLVYGKASQGYANDAFIALGDPSKKSSVLTLCQSHLRRA